MICKCRTSIYIIVLKYLFKCRINVFFLIYKNTKHSTFEYNSKKKNVYCYDPSVPHC